MLAYSVPFVKIKTQNRHLKPPDIAPKRKNLLKRTTNYCRQVHYQIKKKSE